MRSKYVIKDQGNWWSLRASNGKIISVSCTYKDRRAMLKAMKKLVETLNWGTRYTEACRIRKGPNMALHRARAATRTPAKPRKASAKKRKTDTDRIKKISKGK